MKENSEETRQNLSKVEKQFVELVNKNPKLVFEALCYNDLIKPLVWQDSISNGGKLGYRGIATKFKISNKKARWILEKIKERND